MRIVAVTGASGYVGQRVVAQLAAAPHIERILALDIRPATFTSDKVTFIRHDVAQPMTELFEQQGVDAAAHFAFVLNPTHDRVRERQVNVGGTENFLQACHAVQAQVVLVTSSATAYGAWPDNPPLLKETMPLRGKPGFAYVQDKVQQDLLTQQYAQGHPQSRVIITRMSVVMGPHVDNYISRYFLKSLAIVCGEPIRLPRLCMKMMSPKQRRNYFCKRPQGLTTWTHRDPSRCARVCGPLAAAPSPCPPGFSTRWPGWPGNCACGHSPRPHPPCWITSVTRGRVMAAR
ncbi:MAG: NAD-dependent epimerase/dehydratase family protein [Chloroflexi bacterium]|nr:NAD-dependent epimerase/dehydratase family protein [Chloroflexota bacterium]